MISQAVPNCSPAPHNADLAAYRLWLVQQGMTPNTMRVYVSRIKHFIAFLSYSKDYEKSLKSPDALEEAIDRYILLLRQTNAKSKSINGNINALNNFARYLGFSIAPCERERSEEKHLNVLTLDEQMRFLRCVDQQPSARDRALCLVLFYTGLRIGDCAVLQAADIAASAQTIYLGNAHVPVNKQTSIALLQWLAERRAVSQGQPDSALWLTKQGEQLSISGITFILKRIGWQAKLVISSELLRRTALTYSTSSVTRRNRAITFGAYLSEATINRYAP